MNKHLTLILVLIFQFPVGAQTELPSVVPPASFWELVIHQETTLKPCPRGLVEDPATITCNRISLTHINFDNVVCGRLPSELETDGVPNPIGFGWDDPLDPTKACRLRAPTVVLSLPIGTKYIAAIRAGAIVKDATGADKTVYSKWWFDSITFRRAPRGVPCPNGAPGTLFTTEADVNGKPVQLSACINAQ